MVPEALSHIRRNAVAYVALFVALGGTTYAAIEIPKGAVGSREVKNNSLRSGDIRTDSLTGADIDEAKLACAAIAGCSQGEGQGAPGPAGPPGPPGPEGPEGPRGSRGS